MRGHDTMKRVAFAIAMLLPMAAEADAMTLRDAVRGGYEVKTASGFWVILQKEKSIVFCNTQSGSSDIPCLVVD
jgi:hypothetical protein